MTIISDHQESEDCFIGLFVLMVVGISSNVALSETLSMLLLLAQKLEINCIIFGLVLMWTKLTRTLDRITVDFIFLDILGTCIVLSTYTHKHTHISSCMTCTIHTRNGCHNQVVYVKCSTSISSRLLHSPASVNSTTLRYNAFSAPDYIPHHATHYWMEWFVTIHAIIFVA